jgi:hypothetical protein
MGTSTRPPLTKINESPGPGSYELPSKIKEGAKLSMGMKLDIGKTIPLPGPGQYSVDDKLTKKTAPGFSAGKEKRDPVAIKGSIAPGPGNYDNNTEIGKKGTGFG